MVRGVTMTMLRCPASYDRLPKTMMDILLTVPAGDLDRTGSFDSLC